MIRTHLVHLNIQMNDDLTEADVERMVEAASKALNKDAEVECALYEEV